jgi:hypothetical protein
MDDARRARLSSMGGDPPVLATPVDVMSAGMIGETAQIKHGPGGRASRSGRLNLRAVAEVLGRYDLDPIEEVARVVTALEPVLDGDGKPVIGDDGKPAMRPVLDATTRLRTLLELAQYSRPKLKAIEVQHKPTELTDEQIDRRLEALLDRRAAEKS